MMPIPKKLLIHKAVLQVPGDLDAWQSTTYTDTPLSYIRIESSNKVIVTKDNTEKQLIGTLIYDCKNSIPKNIVFEPKQKIVFNNREYTVEIVDLLYDNNKLHHLELGLV